MPNARRCPEGEQVAAALFALLLQPDLNKAADGLRAQIFLFVAPPIHFLGYFRLDADANKLTGYRRAPFWCFHVNTSEFSHESC